MPEIGMTFAEIEALDSAGDRAYDDRRQREVDDEAAVERACEAIDRISEAVIALKHLGQWP